MATRRHIGNKGQALVELALSMFLLLLLVFGIVEFGRAFYIYNTLNNAAREGARRAIVTPAPWDITALENVVRNAIQVDTTGLVITVTPNAAPTSGSGATVKVNATLPFNTIVGQLLPSLKNKNITGEASFRYEL